MSTQNNGNGNGIGNADSYVSYATPHHDGNKERKEPPLGVPTFPSVSGTKNELNAPPGRDLFSAPTLLEIIIAPAGPDLSRLRAPWGAHRAADHARRQAVLRMPTGDDDLAGYAADWVVIVHLPDYQPTSRMFGRPPGCGWLAAGHASLDDLVAETWREFGRHRACRWTPHLMDAEDVAYVADLLDMLKRGEP